VKPIPIKAVWLTFLLALSVSQTGHPAADSLSDPIVATIEKSDLRVSAVDFVRAPKTIDSSTGIANNAYARIQTMTPMPGGSNRLMFNDLRGLLYVTDTEGKTPTIYLDIRKYGAFGFDDSMFPNETGLVGFAFHPQFSEPGKPGFGKFYTAYSARLEGGTADYLQHDAGSHESVIREWTTRDPQADQFSGTSRKLLRVGQFAPNHNIGTLAFNPSAAAGSIDTATSTDYGLLYASFGDGGAANDPRDYGQSLNEPSGAIIRIDPLGGDQARAYGIPADNPFIGDPAAAPEIWAYGLRHPQHFSWDTEGRMFIADIGQNQVEEINLGSPGANYGWRLREGSFATAFAVGIARAGLVYPRPAVDEQPFVYPIAEYDHDEGNAVAGGFVYQGEDIPELRGKYVFTELVRGRLLYIDTADLSNPPMEIREIRLYLNGREQDLEDVAGFANTYAPGKRVDLRLGIDHAGELYLLTKGDGWIRKLVSLLPSAAPSGAPSGAGQ
jgi:hypothetical protein